MSNQLHMSPFVYVCQYFNLIRMSAYCLRVSFGYRKTFFIMVHKLTSRRCQVCRHDERWRVELLRAGGASLDSLAEKFKLNRDAIHRHYRDHVSAEMKAGYLAGPVQLQELAAKAAETGGSVLDHLHAVRTVLMGVMANMVEAGDGRGASYVAGRLTTTLETIARVSGELGSLANSITINNTNVAVLTEHPSFIRVQATLLHALADHPEARAAVVAALQAMDAANAPAPAAAKVINHVAA